MFKNEYRERLIVLTFSPLMGCKLSKWYLGKVSVKQKVNQADLFQINNKVDCDLVSDVIAK